MQGIFVSEVERTATNELHNIYWETLDTAELFTIMDLLHRYCLRYSRAKRGMVSMSVSELRKYVKLRRAITKYIAIMESENYDMNWLIQQLCRINYQGVRKN